MDWSDKHCVCVCVVNHDRIRNYPFVDVKINQIEIILGEVVLSIFQISLSNSFE